MTAQTFCGTVALIGKPNSGKSSLLNAIIGEKIAPVTHRPQTTRNQLRGIFTEGNHQVVFVDTPGLFSPKTDLHKHMIKQAHGSLDSIDAVVWIEDVSHAPKAEVGHVGLLEKLANAGVPIILGLNKIDKLKSRVLALPVIDFWQSKINFAAIVPFSAKDGTGVQELVAQIKKSLPEREFMFDKDEFTTATEREIAIELIREKVMLAVGSEIPHQVAVSIDHFNESRREDEKKPIVEISAILHAAKKSQKPILIGDKGSKLKSIGTSARMDLEKLLGCKVMLKLFVKVDEDWVSSKTALKKHGFS